MAAKRAKRGRTTHSYSRPLFSMTPNQGETSSPRCARVAIHWRSSCCEKSRTAATSFSFSAMRGVARGVHMRIQSISCSPHSGGEPSAGCEAPA